MELHYEWNKDSACRELGTREKCACVHPTTTAELILVVVVNILDLVLILPTYFTVKGLRGCRGAGGIHISA